LRNKCRGKRIETTIAYFARLHFLFQPFAISPGKNIFIWFFGCISAAHRKISGFFIARNLTKTIDFQRVAKRCKNNYKKNYKNY